MALHKLVKAVARCAVGSLVAASLCVGTAGAQTARPSPEWAKVLEAAKKEGKVFLYTATIVPVTNRIVAGFKKAHPDIGIEFVRGATGDLLPKLDQELASNVDGADVFISTDLQWFRDKAKASKLLKPLGPSAANWPARFQHENGRVVTIALEPLVILYNTAQVKPAPRSYADVLDPKYKGKVATSGLAATTLVAWYDWLEKTQGPTYLARLKAQEPKLYNGATPIGQAVASGEVVISPFGNVSIAKALAETGAPIDFVVPSPGLGISYGMGVLGWARRPNAAMVFAEYMMSREGQEILNGRGEMASPLPDIKGSLQSSSITPWDTEAYPPEVVKKYTERWNSIFK